MDLLGLAEVAELLGVTKQNIANWRSRREDFPGPIANLKSGPVWAAEAILSWAESEEIEVQYRPGEEAGEKAARNAVVVAMLNMKGGVGKSTLTANFGWHAAVRRDLRVLLIDLDPQFNLSQYVLGVNKFENLIENNDPTIDELFKPLPHGKPRPSLSDLIQHVNDYDDDSCLHLVPARLELAWSIKHSEQVHILQDEISEIKNKYDLIIIDCSPSESILTRAAYKASDYIAVPVKPEFLSTIGLPLLVKSIEEFGNLYPNDSTPEIIGIIFNDVSDKIEHRRAKNSVRKTAKGLGIPIFENEVGHSDSYPVGARKGQPIFWTGNARDTKKYELTKVATEFLNRIGL
jgi:chromosome partitioning protein